MAKTKKKHGAKKNGGVCIPKRSNSYIQKRDARVNAYRTAEADTMRQFMTDTLMLTLNDPKVMKKDVFGKKRLRLVVAEWGKKYDEFHPALEEGDEQDYHQDKLDQALRGIIGDDLVPFPERYDWVKV